MRKTSRYPELPKQHKRNKTLFHLRNVTVRLKSGSQHFGVHVGAQITDEYVKVVYAQDTQNTMLTEAGEMDENIIEKR